MKFLLLISLSFFALNSYANQKTDCGKYEQYTDVSLSEMKNLVGKKSATVIDVNSEKSFKRGHIPGAIHYATHKTDFAKVLPKDKNATIIAYCGGKMCTAWRRAAKAACEMGYKNIRHFSEGIKGWNKKSNS